ncbi:MAG: adhesin [Nitrosomonas sp.]|nr:adhesin [Nitrosomonas sp.]MDP1950826.1 adhesin [Nitrosomonas sp.]
MKSNQNTRKTTWLRLAPIALVIGLTACGEDGGISSISSIGSSSSEDYTMSDRDKPTGAATGVLMGARQVAGISYITSSGKSGVTDEDGIFNYDHGDTVEFKLGGLTLGNTQGSPVMTPIALANGNANKLQNLLVLLQSLDSDGDPSNGISITARTAAAVDRSINLTDDPDTFASSTRLQEILEAGGIDGDAMTAAEASAHFLAQSTVMFGGDVWVRYNDRLANMIRIASDGSGEYLHGQASPDDSCTVNRVCAGRTLYRAGVEHGFARASAFDTRGFVLTGETTIDTNLNAGLSHLDPDAERRIRTDGYELIASDIINVQMERDQPSIFSELFHIGGASSTVRARTDIVPKKEVVDRRFKRIKNDPSGILGAWAYDKDAMNTQTLLFFANNKFMMINPTGKTQRKDQAHCAEPGIEFASYTYNKGNNQLVISGFTYNTDGCSGLSGSDNNKFTISSDGNTAQLEKQGDEPVTVYRISR